MAATLVKQIESIEQGRIGEIVVLHNEIVGLLEMSLDKAIRIGELLTEQKSGLQHGEFLPWIKAHLPFGERTAQNYIRLHTNRALLKYESVSYLTEAYNLLTAHQRIPEPEIPENWDYDTSVNKVRDLMQRIVETKHAIGKRILQDYDKFGKPKYGSKRIENLAKDLQTTVTDLHYCIEFAKKYPDFETFIAETTLDKIANMVITWDKRC